MALLVSTCPEVTKWQDFIRQLFADWTEAQQLKEICSRQRNAIERAMDKLADVLKELDVAQGKEAKGREIIRRVSGNLVLPTDPFVHVDAAGLQSLVKKIRMEFDSELVRVGLDPEVEAAEKAEKRTRYDYRHAMQSAGKEYRKTPKGRSEWDSVQKVVLAITTRQESSSVLDKAVQDKLKSAKTECQQMLDSFYREACNYAGLEPIENEFPRIGG